MAGCLLAVAAPDTAISLAGEAEAHRILNQAKILPEDLTRLRRRAAVVLRVPPVDQKSIVTLNRRNRGFRIAVGRSHVAPSNPNAWLYPVGVFALNRL